MAMCTGRADISTSKLFLPPQQMNMGMYIDETRGPQPASV